MNAICGVTKDSGFSLSGVYYCERRRAGGEAVHETPTDLPALEVFQFEKVILALCGGVLVNSAPRDLNSTISIHRSRRH